MKALLALLLMATPAAAQTVQPCDWIARADAIVEPWQDNTRTFANDAVRLALLDTVEPAAGAYHLLILSPPRNEMGERQCLTLGMGASTGFAGADFANLTASYDPATGLTFQMPVQVFNGEDFDGATLVFALNQSTGAVSAGLE